MFADKCAITKEQNIFLAKKYLIANIYSGARIEGINVTFPETEAIVSGVNVGRLSVDAIQTIVNLKHAWQYVLSSNESFSLNFVLRVNEEVSRNESLGWGVLRNGRIGIGGTDYVPPVPVKEDVDKELSRIMALPAVTERALEYYAYAVKAQLFWDGNKRTSAIVANKLLIDGGAGILHIKEQNFLEFSTLLQRYYNTDDKLSLKTFFYRKCIMDLDMNSGNESG